MCSYKIKQVVQFHLSIGVFIAGLGKIFLKENNQTNYIMSIILCSVNLILGVVGFVSTLGIVMNDCPSNIDLDGLTEQLLRIDGVVEVKEVFAHSVTDRNIGVSVSLVAKNVDVVYGRVKEKCKANGLDNNTLEIESLLPMDKQKKKNKRDSVRVEAFDATNFIDRIMEEELVE